MTAELTLLEMVAQVTGKPRAPWRWDATRPSRSAELEYDRRFAAWRPLAVGDTVVVKSSDLRGARGRVEERLAHDVLDGLGLYGVRVDESPATESRPAGLLCGQVVVLPRHMLRRVSARKLREERRAGAARLAELAG